MKFDEFERLERFNILTNKMQELNKPQSQEKPKEKTGGLVIRNDGSHTRE
jgi:hypothetical protein